MVHIISASAPSEVETGQWFSWQVTGQLDFGDTQAHLWVEIRDRNDNMIYNYDEWFTVLSYGYNSFTTSQRVKINQPGEYTIRFILQAQLFIVYAEDKKEQTITVTGEPQTGEPIIQSQGQQPGFFGIPAPAPGGGLPGLPEVGSIFGFIVMILVLWLIIQMVKK
jgi:hypothetical protein